MKGSPLWCAHCHCTMCRQTHGAAFVTWVGYKTEDVSITEKDATLIWHQSSDDAERGFCSVCGSSIFFRSGQWPGEFHITLSNIEEPHQIVPQGHAFYGTHVNWVVIADDLPRRDSSDDSSDDSSLKDS